MSLGPAEIGLIVLAVMLLFSYKKLPDASRSLGRSLRIFKSEVEELREPAGAADEYEAGGRPSNESAGAQRSTSRPSQPTHRE